ncbi:MAG: phosphatidylglycerophosphatase A [Deltaproteobacteria bacterium]|nr:phosphatidylglycerophosphatase A [Deltaproteobacteria bacterium]
MNDQPARTLTTQDRLILALATAGGAGYAPKAPGTFGSVVGCALFLLYIRLNFASLVLFLAGVLLLSVLGVWVSDKAGQLFECTDDGRIVIDEVAGQLLTLSPLLLFDRVPIDPLAGWGVPAFFFWVVTGFVLFRLFDIWKPGFVGLAERSFPGGAGVMMDDLVAGVFGALILEIMLWGAQIAELPFALARTLG